MAKPTDVWTKITSSTFTLLSCAGERETLDWAVEFEAFFTEVAATLPTSKQGRAPIVFLLFPSDAALAPLKPVVDGRPHSSMAFVFRLRSGAVVLMSAQDRENVQRRLIYHDGVHWLMGSQANRQPLWFQEGLAELFSSFEVKGAQRSLGMPIKGHVEILEREALLPMAKFLSVEHSSWLYDEATRTNPFYAQARAFAHMMYLNRDTALRSSVAQYLAQVPAGTENEDAFRAAFGMSYAEMEKRIGEHLANRRYGVSRIPIDRAALLAKLTRANAEPGEVTLAVGRLQIAQRRFDEATKIFRAAHAARPDDPWVLLSLGELALMTDGYDAAFNLIDRSINHGMDLECAYLWRARTRLYLASTPKGSGKQVPPDVARLVADDFIEAARRNPRDRQTLRELSGPLVTAKPRRPADRVILEQAVKFWPSDPFFLMNLAALDVEEGRIAEASAGWEKVAALNPPAPTALREQAKGLLVSLKAATMNAEHERLLAAKDYAKLRESYEELLRTGDPARAPAFRGFLRALEQQEALERAIALLGKDDREAERMLHEVARSPHADMRMKSDAKMHLRKLTPQTEER